MKGFLESYWFEAGEFMQREGDRGQAAALLQRIDGKKGLYTLLYFLYDLERVLFPRPRLPPSKQMEHPLLSSLKQKQYYKHVLFQLIAPQPTFLSVVQPLCSLFFL